MKTKQSSLSRWWTVVIFAIAMAWVESAVVFYLRTMIHRIDPFQLDPLPREFFNTGFKIHEVFI